MSNFWEECDQLHFANESEVGTKLVLPMLTELGFSANDVKSEKSVDFSIQRGSRTTGSRADYMVFAGEPYDKTSALITVELKAPSEAIADAKRQAESYAANYGTPLVVLCNGATMQIWQLQPSSESECLLKIEGFGYNSNRGEIEALLLKQAAIALCEGLTNKSLHLAIDDLSGFENAEHVRLSSFGPFLDRTARAMGQSQLPELSTEGFENLGANTVIVGKSGFGKSTFGRMIAMRLLQNRSATGHGQVPVEISLPELSVSGAELENFAVSRIAAYNPSITKHNFRRVIATHGLVLVLDGLNRIASKQQKSVIAMANAIARDHANVRVLILSNALPILNVQNTNFYELREFERSDLENLAEVNGLSRYIWTSTPKVIDEMSKIPVLATRLVRRYQDSGVFFQRIDQVFEEWLRTGLEGHTELERIQMLEFLQKAAEATRKASIDAQSLIALSRDAGFPAEISEDLMSTGLLVVSGNSVELAHETLATYIRARSLMSLQPHNVDAYISRYGEEEHHLFFAILMAIVPNRELQSCVWNAALQLRFSHAIGCLRYRFDLANQLEDLPAEKRSESYLEDVLEAIAEPTKRYFEPLMSELCFELSGYQTHELGIEGYASDGSVSYTFFDASDSDTTVMNNSSPLSGHRRGYGDSLTLQGFRLDSGRIIGLKRLQNALQSLCKNRRLKGGRTWLEDRSFGRLRFLEKRFNFPKFGEEVNIENVIQTLQNQAGSWAENAFDGAVVTFPIDELVADLKHLKSAGMQSLKRWWLSQSDIDLTTEKGRRNYANMVDAYYRRAQEIYFELAETIPQIKRELRGARNRPHRYSIAVEDYEEAWKIKWRRSHLPVVSLSDAGADVYFEDDDADFLDPEDCMDDYAELYKRKLIDVGRLSEDWNFSWGSGYAPDFEGNDTSFGNIRYETAAMSLAHKWIKEDIESLFGELPSSDGRRGAVSEGNVLSMSVSAS